MGAVFISYRRGDSEGQARALSNDLAERIGEDSVFMDVDSIALGLDFRQVLQERLQSCEIMLALIGPNWLEAKDSGGSRRLDSPTDFVRQEIAAALKRNIPVTPVLLQGAQMPAPDRLPDDLKELSFRNGFELSHTRWESDVAEMVRRLGLDKRKVAGGSPQAMKGAPPSQTAGGSGMAAGLTGTGNGARKGRFLVPIGIAAASIVGTIALLAWLGGSGDESESFEPIVAGVRQIVLGGGGVAGPVAGAEDVWVPIASADESVPSPRAFVAARVYGSGRAAAFGHDGLLSAAQADNSVFLANLVGWLLDDKGGRVCFTTSHGELNAPALRASLDAAGFEARTVPETITSITISGCGLVVINNAGRRFEEGEIQTVADYVDQGGGLLLGGLGWAYAEYSETKNIQDYPMLQVGRVFGVKWPTSYLAEPDPGNQPEGLTVFRTLYPNAKW